MTMRAYMDARANLIAIAPAAAASARALSDLTDAAISRIAQAASEGFAGRWAVCAIGGYGARRLLPASDIDLLVLTDARSRQAEPFVHAVLYPLWDTGLKVGHQVRTAKEHAVACREDTEIRTASLTGRVVAGDAAFGEQVLQRVAQDARRHGTRCLADLAARTRPGSPYQLEPDLKEGAGGQRDLDELVWTAAILTGSAAQDVRRLGELGVVTSAAVDRLLSAGDAITAARWSLQASTNGSSSLLDIDSVADLPLDVAVLQRGLSDVHHILLDVRASVSRRAVHPARPVGCASPGAAAADAPTVLGLVWSGAAAVPALERLAWAGALDGLIDGFSDLLTLRRPALSHRFTVGAHALRAATLVPQMLDEDRLAANHLVGSHDPDSLIVAALTHDLGKAYPGPDHAAAGAAPAASAARAFGLSEVSIGMVAELVRHHLLLSEAIATCDLDVEDDVLHVAARLVDRGLVWPLYLLTAVDGTATGPDVWTAWRRSLVGRLALLLDDALSDNVTGAGIVTTAEDVRVIARELVMKREDPQCQIAFIDGAPIRYLAGRSPAEVATNARLVASVGSRATTAGVRVDVGLGELPGTYEATIATHDHPGLLAELCGCFALAGLDILGVDAYTDAAGIALDDFTIRSATLATPEHDTWSRLERLLVGATTGHLGLETRLAEHQAHYASRRGTRRAKVATDTSSPFSTAVRVTAADRPGLLHDIARTISDAGFDIRSATALTQDVTAVDTFRIVDDLGEAPREPGPLGQLSMKLRERLSRP